MAALKIAREAGAHEPDNMADAIGYLSMLNEVRNVPTEPYPVEARLERAERRDDFLPGRN